MGAMMIGAVLPVSQVEMCDLQGQGPWWFWLALAVTSLVAFEVHRRRNALRETLCLSLMALLVEGFF